MTGAHFEQSGRVTGWTRFGIERGAERHEIDALGQRDKSWGVRDWARLEGWNWLAGHPGRDRSPRRPAGGHPSRAEALRR
jgi:hypothetical protein